MKYLLKSIQRKSTGLKWSASTCVFSVSLKWTFLRWFLMRPVVGKAWLQSSNKCSQIWSADVDGRG